MTTMRRHTPSLYTHHESPNGDDWSPSHTYGSSSSGTGSLKRASKLKQRPSSSMQQTSHSRNYSDIYNRFLRRYRSEPEADDQRHAHDNHYFLRGMGAPVDGLDSDDEDSSVLAASGESDRGSMLMFDSESIRPETVEDRERLEWQTMLASVLSGDVLRTEKSRIATALETTNDELSHMYEDIWIGLRAKLRGRTVEEERKLLEERRLRVVDRVLDEVLHFRVDTTEATNDPYEAALLQVNRVIHRLDVATSLYPCVRAFHTDKPAAQSKAFQARVDTLNSWSNILSSLQHETELLRRWTGNDNLDVIQETIGSVSETFGNPISNQPEASTFIDRLLKEENVQRQFEKGSMTTIHALVGAARDTQVNLWQLFTEMNLPTFETVLVPLVSFATNLSHHMLRVRLEYARKLKDPEVLIIDQMLEDIKVKVGFACTLKRQYDAFLVPDSNGNWNLPPCIILDYDRIILEALVFFFKLIHWKLKSGVKGIYFKETDIIESHWATFQDVSLTIPGGSAVVAEELCALTNKMMVRVTNYFENQIRMPASSRNRRGVDGTALPAISRARSALSEEQIVNWYATILDGVRIRYRKLQRFGRALAQRLQLSAEYSIEGVEMEHLVTALIDSDHFLVYTHTYEEDSTYIIAPPSLRDNPSTINRLLTQAFHIGEEEEISMFEAKEEDPDSIDFVDYILVLSPTSRFIWSGLVLLLELPRLDLDMKENRIRLIADGTQARLSAAKRQFCDIFTPVDEDGELLDPICGSLPCVVESQSHLPNVNNELRKITRATNRLAQSIVDSVHHVRTSLQHAKGHQDLLENWYLFASEHGQHILKQMSGTTLIKFNQLLIKLAISWVSFICDDCDPNQRVTFKWAVNALEFALQRTKRNNILQLPDDQFELLRQKVASCMTLLISHFDILGARQEATQEKERQELAERQAVNTLSEIESDAMLDIPVSSSYVDPAVRMFWERISNTVRELDARRSEMVSKDTVGRVLDEEKMVDRSLVSLAASSSNISIRWQQGRFIGAGSFGSVYLAVNLDTGALMAVKEIKYTEVAGLPNLHSQIKDELAVMEMLHHPNVVEYYGIEVHRDKVYIFEEYCQGGTLASLLEHGRIEDEGLIQVYTMQMLEGLAYLHGQGVVHRDVKPDNILLDHMGVIKFVDFGAAKILAKNQRSMQRSRRVMDGLGTNGGGLGMNNSLTGTPMYMSPEIIRNGQRGRSGAMDIWAMGCVVLECATGKKPWSNLDNEWAIMFHIGVATQHPPLPEPGQLSEAGVNFLKECLTIDPFQRPPAKELMDSPWMLEFREALMSYEEVEMQTSPPVHVDESFDHASVARQATIIHEQEIEAIRSLSPSSPADTPFDSIPPLPL